jgi:ATP-dependent Clp protease protease subunit
MANFIMDGEKPVFYLQSGITENSVKELCGNLMEAKNGGYSKIKISLNTTGGSVHQMASLIAVMQDLKAQGIVIETVGTGNVASAGTLILSSGSNGYRYVYPHTQLMIHNPSFNGGGENILSEIDKKELESSKELITSLYLQTTKIEVLELKKMLEKTTYFNAEESVSFGFADEILQPVASVNLEINQSNKINKKMENDDLIKMQKENADLRERANLEKQETANKLAEIEASKHKEVVACAEELYHNLGFTENVKKMLENLGKTEGISAMLKASKEFEKPKAGILTQQTSSVSAEKAEPKTFEEKVAAGVINMKNLPKVYGSLSEQGRIDLIMEAKPLFKEYLNNLIMKGVKFKNN